MHVKDVAEAIVRASEAEGNIGEKYLVVSQNMTFKEITQMVTEISAVPLPRLVLPGFLAMTNARLLTLLADLMKKPPMWGMAVDQIMTMKAGGAADGSKTEKELGVTYTPIRQALEDAIESYRDPATAGFVKVTR